MGNEYITMFGADGKQIGIYTVPQAYSGTLTFSAGEIRTYFGGRLVGAGGTGIVKAVIQDRLGSVGKYYPFGEERNSPHLQDDAVKFATYTRDSATGNDYADNRYYTSNLGRFLTPDPYQASTVGAADPATPKSWNRYSYASSDPVNSYDPRGLIAADPDGYCPASEPSCDDGDGLNVALDSAGTHSCSVRDVFAQLGGIIYGFVNSRSYGSFCPDVVPAVAADPDPPQRSSPVPPDCNRLLGFNLDYSQLLYKKGTQSTKDHIIERHMYGTTSGTSQYYAPTFDGVMGLDALTYLFGAETYDATTNTFAFVWTFPQITPGGNHIGTDASGNETATNRLIVKADCKTVITSYPVPGND